MDELSVLKINARKLSAEIQSIEGELSRLTATLGRSDALLETQKRKAIEYAEAEFMRKQQELVGKINAACRNTCTVVEEHLDSLPDMRIKEYAGKYEIKSLEQHLYEIYPKELIDNYVCTDLLEFEDEGDAYAVYVSLERRVMRIRQGTAFSSIFSGIVSLLTAVTKSNSASSKVAALLLAVLVLSILLSPLLFCSIFSVVGLASALHGVLIHGIIRDLMSIKSFLNEAYDEDIFQNDKSDIMSEVSEFVTRMSEVYTQRVQKHQFKMDPAEIRKIEQQAQDLKQKTQSAVDGKTQLLAAKKQQLSKMLDDLERLQEEKKNAASKLQEAYLSHVDWKYEWLAKILIDVTPENTIVTANWPKTNVLYYSQSLSDLENFRQLGVYQTMLHMPPDYCGQVVLDYRYMGSNLLTMTRAAPSLLAVCIDKDDIALKMDRLQEDLRGRVNSILKSCENIESFNAMMKEYGSVGEAYVLVHICGLQSFDESLLNIMKNGPKVGYYFRLYATIDELIACKASIPFEDFGEYYEVSSKLTARSSAAIHRIIDGGT